MTTSPLESPSSPRPLAVSIEQAATITNICRSSLYEEIKAGRLRSLKIGKRRLVRLDALDEWLRSHEVS